MVAEQLAANERWSAAGAPRWCGWPDEPLLDAPRALLATLDRWAEPLTTAGARRWRDDPLELLVERAELAGTTRAGSSSVGGATRIVTGLDGHVGLTLSRPDDLDLLPALLRCDTIPDDSAGKWSAVAAAVAEASVPPFVRWGVELGLPIAQLGELAASRPGVIAHLGPGGMPIGTLEGRRVVNLASLWAGPLCAALLAAAGASVTTIESVTRPDGSRVGDPVLFERLHAGQTMVSLDLRAAEGRRELIDRVAAADVVITGSRRRALVDLGLDPLAWSDRGPAIWVAITGYGLAVDRVAFGDDAAIAGGLVGWTDRGPVCCLDAVADPLTGVAAAAAVVDHLAAPQRVVLDVAMAAVAAEAAS